MVDVGIVHDKISFLIKKKRWSFVPPEEIDIAIDLAQNDLFENFYGNTNKYRYGRPIPPSAYGQTSGTTDPLLAFIKHLPIDSINGWIDIPTDYIHLDSGFLFNSDTSEYKPLPLVNTDKKAFRANSQLMPVNDKTDMSNAFISFAFDIDKPSTLGIQLYPRADPVANECLRIFIICQHQKPRSIYTQ